MSQRNPQGDFRFLTEKKERERPRTPSSNASATLAVRLHIHSAIDAQDLSGDITCPGAGQEYDGIRNFLRFPKASHGSHGFDVGESILRHAVDHIRFDKPGGNGIYGDSLASQFPGK